MAKVLDRIDSIPIDVARRIDRRAKHDVPPPSPGAPPGLAVPLNLTGHEAGLMGWTYDDFATLAREGKRRNGKPLDPFMPVESLRNMNDVERRALWAYLASVPPRPFGSR